MIIMEKTHETSPISYDLIKHIDDLDEGSLIGNQIFYHIFSLMIGTWKLITKVWHSGTFTGLDILTTTKASNKLSPLKRVSIGYLCLRGIGYILLWIGAIIAFSI